MRRRPLISAVMVFYFLIIGFSFSSAIATADEPPVPVTAKDPSIPSEELELLVEPLTKDELLIEADGWQELVKDKAHQIALAQIAVKRQNREIEKAKAAQTQAHEAKAELKKVESSVDKAKVTGGSDEIAESSEAAEAAQEKMQEVSDTVQEAAEAAEKTAEVLDNASLPDQEGLGDAAEATDEAQEAIADVQDTVDQAEGKTADEIRTIAADAQQATEEAKAATSEVQVQMDGVLEDAEQTVEQTQVIEQAGQAMAQAKEAKKEEKVDLLERITQFREERTLLLDNMRTVVDELETKTDQDDSETLAAIKDYRLYMQSVSGITVDVTDTTSTWVSLKGWLTSEEGGVRWAINLAKFVGILIITWFLAVAARGLLRRLTQRVEWPVLLADFLIRSVYWVVWLVGFIWALSSLEISITPLLAIVGAAGFILAFAMQDSLSNFASGLMILLFRPFDVGDVVDAGGVSGTVESMNLVSTTIKTFDNKIMLVPNNSIWRDVITNASTVDERRVDMEFGIGYSDDIDRAHEILEEIVSSHPLVLKDPAPTIRMNTLADSSVNFICRPWAKTSDYWSVYWDVIKAVKKRFDAEGIGIPFPQRDVHLYIEDSQKKETVNRVTGQTAFATVHPTSLSNKTQDGGLDGEGG